ncbi:unnamed protein product [Hyaloperonospora brassicae]|uniref:HTH myb-type domain-containing protein n=1 Tax=Hyaloperonospora brassicae TaxID=162125 RepID=A0AAV0UJF8_HYABA|nr:unnamed protein product [Hyaloperonospora brassicae]
MRWCSEGAGILPDPSGDWRQATCSWTKEKVQPLAEDGKPVPEGRGVWTPEEHQLFVDGIKLFPSGPWKDIASHVRTRTARQTMTHAQKYRQKIVRRLRNARVSGKFSLPFLLEQSSRFNVLLSTDEQFSDSILATSLAIAAEQELARLGVLSDGGASPTEIGVDPGTAWGSVFTEPADRNNNINNINSINDSDLDLDDNDLNNTYQKHLPLAINFSSSEGSPYYLDGPSFEPNDIEFDKCMDFLIETFHHET